MIGVLAVALVASIGLGYGWLAMSKPDDESTSSTREPTPSTSALAIEPQDVSNPLVVPIDDASDVVAQIDDNSAEEEALDLLGLDQTGNPLAAGHRFTWSFGTDETTTITVDATTGNYAFESSDGFEWRRIDGTSYGRRGDIAWSEVDGDALGSVLRLGADGPVTIDQILDPITDEYASSVTRQLDDGTSAVYAEIDEHGLWNDLPAEHLRWLGLMGIPSPDQAIEPGAIIVVDVVLAADGRTVDTFTVTTEKFASSYTLDHLFETAPVIEVPAF
jgi:hypothetical protein